MTETIRARTWFKPETVWPQSPDVEYLVEGLGGLDWIEVQGLFGAGLSPEQMIRAAGGGLIPPPRKAVEKMLAGVVGWRNFKDAKGNLVEFTRAGVADIIYEHTIEVSAEISQRSQIGGEQEKNLSSQSRSPRTAGNSTAPDANGAATATKQTPLAMPSTS